jgi:hypothetical protein
MITNICFGRSFVVEDNEISLFMLNFKEKSQHLFIPLLVEKEEKANGAQKFALMAITLTVP